jgi:hypothetical protein
MGAQEELSQGWSYLEYAQACTDAVFLKSIEDNLDADPDAGTIEEKLAAKGCIAGASTRWMFHETTQKVLLDIQRQISEVESMGALIRGVQGVRSDHAVNQLTTTLDGVHTLVSLHVTRQLSTKVEKSFLAWVTNYAWSLETPNGSFDGWVFQMDFLARLRSGERQITFFNDTETWNANKCIDFYHEEELKGSTLDDEDWLIPTKINQGCYDALQLCGSTLRVVQLTVAQTHDLKLQYVVKVLRVLDQMEVKITNLDVVFVVPHGNTEKFKVKSVLSDQNVAITSRQWTTGNVRIKGFVRANCQ